jgi:hypothetical protein
VATHWSPANTAADGKSDGIESGGFGLPVGVCGGVGGFTGFPGGDVWEDINVSHRSLDDWSMTVSKMASISVRHKAPQYVMYKERHDIG